MIMGAMVAGLAGAVLSGAGALAAGSSWPGAFGWYAAGGSATMLLALAAGRRRPRPAEGPRLQTP